MKNSELYLSKTEVSSLVNDTLKILTMIVVYNILTYAIDNNSELFDENTLKLMLYLTIGIIIYHVVITRIRAYYSKQKN